MASPTPLLPPSPSLFSLSGRRRTLSKPATLLAFPLGPAPKCKLLASSPPPPPPIPTRIHTLSPLTGSTRNITTIVPIGIALSKFLASKISLLLSLKLAPFLPIPNNTLATLSRPAFFAAISNSSAPRSMVTPIAVFVARLERWLAIYSCVLLIRVLLDWFPNIPRDDQQMSAIKDFCESARVYPCLILWMLAPFWGFPFVGFAWAACETT